MATLELADYVDTLRREILALGSTTVIDDDVLSDYMVDAFWEARLDGFFGGYDVTLDGTVIPAAGMPDFPREGIAVLTLYSAVKIIRNRILSTQSRFKAVAGPVEFETQQSPTLLTEMLRQLSTMKARLVELGPGGNRGTYVGLVDGFAGRSMSDDAYLGWAGLTEALPGGY